MNIKNLILLLVAVTLVVIGFLLWFSQEPGPDGADVDLPIAAHEAPLAKNTFPKPLPGFSPVIENETAGTQKMVFWDNKIDDILRNVRDDEDVLRQKLFAIAQDSTAPRKARLRALEHGLDLLDEKFYAEALPFLLGKNGDREMQDTVFFDLESRSEELKLGACIELVKQPDHRLHNNAAELLEFYTGQNFGPDWEAWNNAVTLYLAEASDEA